MTGMKFKSIGGTVQDNQFENLASLAVTLFPEQFFMEGSVELRNISVRGNRANGTAGFASEVGGNGLSWGHWDMEERLFSRISWENN